jgi:putative two-component system response regulator
MKNPQKILIVDDLEPNRNLLRDYVLALGHQSTQAINGLEALAQVKEDPPDLILLDMRMPTMDGYETLELLKEDNFFRHIPVIMVSAVDEMENVIKCIQKGAIDYLVKPFNPTLLAARINSALSAKKLHDREDDYRKKMESYNVRMEGEVWHKTQELYKVRLRIIHRLGRAAEYRGLHAIRMSHYCSKLGAALGWNKDQCDLIFNASPMYDLGKIGISDRILLKPDILDHDEWKIMKTHAAIGASILKGGDSQIELLAEKIALTHHEKWDGTGYPQGLKGEEIPIESRIVSITAVFDALISERSYGKKWQVDKAIGLIEEGSGKDFDPQLVPLFKKILPEILEIKNQFPDE